MYIITNLDIVILFITPKPYKKLYCQELRKSTYRITEGSKTGTWTICPFYSDFFYTESKSTSKEEHLDIESPTMNFLFLKYRSPLICIKKLKSTLSIGNIIDQYPLYHKCSSTTQHTTKYILFLY